MTPMPGSNRFFVAEQYGKIYSFPNRPDVDHADLVADLVKDVKGLNQVPDCKGVEAIYGMDFHPKFMQNHYIYICYVLDHKQQGKHLANGSRISRFTVTDSAPPRLDPASEKVLITWMEGGHNGCTVKFGHDGY